MYCNILVTKPFEKCFTYELRANQKIKRGNIVIIPFGKNKDQIGLVYQISDSLPKEIKKIKIRKVGSIIKNICFSEKLINDIITP